MSLKSGYKILILGNVGTGKTSYVEFLKDSNIEFINYQYTPTIGASYSLIIIDNFLFYVWDSSGDRRFKGLISRYITEVNIILIFFELNNLKTLENAKKTYLECHESNKSAIKILIGNKSDLISNFNEKRKTKIENYLKDSIISLNEKCPEINHVPYFQISLKNKENINLILDYIKVNCPPLIELDKPPAIKRSRSSKLYRDPKLKNRILKKIRNRRRCINICHCLCVSRFF